MPEWLVERGIGETRTALVDRDRILEARIDLEGVTPAGTVLKARLTNIGNAGRNALAAGEDGAEYLLPRGARGIAEGATLIIEVTRSAIPGSEPWKRPLARVTGELAASGSPDRRQGEVRELTFPAPADELAAAGWDDLIEQARTGTVTFAGGELRIFPTPAMTLFDVDGHLPPDELALAGASEAAAAIRRLDIGGSIGIDLPTVGSKAVRQRAAEAFDAALPQPFERTAVNGFGFIQIVRPRHRASLVELAQDGGSFEARSLLRRTAFGQAGAKRLVGHPAVIGFLEAQLAWIAALSRQIGGPVSLRAEASLPMSGGYAENT